LEKGWNVLFRKKKQPGPAGIPGAVRLPGGGIQLNDGTILRKNKAQDSGAQPYHGEEYEQEDFRGQRYRGVRVVNGEVIPQTGWKPANLEKP
jgi:hypothetical protein